MGDSLLGAILPRAKLRPSHRIISRGGMAESHALGSRMAKRRVRKTQKEPQRLFSDDRVVHGATRGLATGRLFQRVSLANQP